MIYVFIFINSEAVQCIQQLNNLISGALGMDNRKQKGREQNNGGNKITNYFSLKNITKQSDKPKYVHMPNGNNKKLSKKTGKGSQYHDSSRQANEQSDNGTQIIISSGDEANNNANKVCKQLIMIGPCDVTYYTSVKSKLERVLNDYSKDKFLHALLENVKLVNKKIENVSNLQKIDDDVFWSRTVPVILDYACNQTYQKSISARLEVLHEGNTGNNQKIRVLSKAQVLMLLINMFLCIFPQQTYRKTGLSFAQLFCTRANQAQSSIAVRLQKLKCLINYFNIITQRNYEDLQNVFITIKRGSSQGKISKQQLTQIQYNLYDVQFKNGLIQSQQNKGAMIDFANKSLGGGVLSNGAVQEEILFVCYPELMCTMCLCEELGNYEGIYIEGVQRFSWYQGYSDTFRFIHKKQYVRQQNSNKRESRKKNKMMQQNQKDVLCPTIFIAVDAINFNTHIMKEKGQFLPQIIDKQIYKFMCAGDLLNQQQTPPYIRIVSGRWGCGAFRGNPYIKFIIQWIACSLMHRDMVYMSSEQQEMGEMKILYGYLRKFNTKQLRQLIIEYHQCFRENNGLKFLDYLKEMC